MGWKPNSSTLLSTWFAKKEVKRMRDRRLGRTTSGVVFLGQQILLERD
jgi:hypothetical protein